MDIKLKFNNDFLSLLDLKKKKYDRQTIILRLIDLIYKNELKTELYNNFLYKSDCNFIIKLNNLLRRYEKNYIIMSLDMESSNNTNFNNLSYFGSNSYLVNGSIFSAMTESVSEQLDMSDNFTNQFDMSDNNLTIESNFSESKINGRKVLHIPGVLRKDKDNSHETMKFFIVHKNIKKISSLFIEKSYNHNIYDEGNKIKKLIL